MVMFRLEGWFLGCGRACSLMCVLFSIVDVVMGVVWIRVPSVNKGCPAKIDT